MKTTSNTLSFSTRRTWLVRAAAALLAALAALAALPQQAHAGVFIGVGVSVGFPPPLLPVYTQPVVPGAGYVWTPGYWAWDGTGYYWVPGTWILAPFYGALWTPGYWGWNSGFYVFHPGYWGHHVGFYGGVNYGFGYTGVGYAGGYWGHGGFFYNRSVTNVTNVYITNVYSRTVINNGFVGRTSYNGGQGGLNVRATPQETAFARESHIGPVAAQQQQMTMASHNQALRASFNHGNPPIAATAHAGAFNGAGAIAAHSFLPSTAHAPRMNNSAMHTQPHSMALHSASFAPHNMAARGGGNAYRPQSTAHARYAAHPAGSNRPSAPAYHPAPQYHAQAYHPAAHPAGNYAPRGGSAARGGGGHAPARNHG